MIKMASWKKFEIAQENRERYMFEQLCRQLFKKRFPGVEHWPNINYNNKGIEMPPAYDTNSKKYVGFQAKYIEERTETNVVYNQIRKSVDRTIQYYVVEAMKEGRPCIEEFYLYCNRTLGEDSDPYKEIKEKLEDVGIKLIAICNEHILDEVNKDANLRDDYFMTCYSLETEDWSHSIYEGIIPQSFEINVELEQIICGKLADYIEIQNIMLDWDETTFMPIEAEVILDQDNNVKEKYNDLFRCINKNRKKESIFLVLGEPGGGKSVSLRKYCHELLLEGKKKGIPRIPLYINLKEWDNIRLDEEWPDSNQVKQFVKDSFISQMTKDESEKRMLEIYFDKMYNSGRWYYVFDSFDELPCLMGNEKTEEFIHHMSVILYQFMSSSKQNGGIIASRLLHQPNEKYPQVSIIHLLPLNEEKIKYMFECQLGNGQEYISKLFQNRMDLIPIAENPLLLSLLIKYMQQHKYEFPENQMQIYQNFTDYRLKKVRERNRWFDWDDEIVIKAACTIATYMLENPEFSRECPIGLLKALDMSIDWDGSILILEKMKICKYSGDTYSVSFVHRRFQEYFFVFERIRKNVSFCNREYEAIQKSNGMRDALVLYNEIVAAQESEKILVYCFNKIRNNLEFSGNLRSEECIELINTVSFMNEAFRSRKNVFIQYEKWYATLLCGVFVHELLEAGVERGESIKKEVNDLEELKKLNDEDDTDQERILTYRSQHDEIIRINSYFDINPSHMVKEVFAQSIGLFSREYQQFLIELIIAFDDIDLTEIVIREARNTIEIDRELEHKIVSQFFHEPLSRRIDEYDKRQFAFSLSPHLEMIQLFLSLQMIQSGLLGFTSVIFLVRYFYLWFSTDYSPWYQFGFTFLRQSKYSFIIALFLINPILAFMRSMAVKSYRFKTLRLKTYLIELLLVAYSFGLFGRITGLITTAIVFLYYLIYILRYKSIIIEEYVHSIKRSSVFMIALVCMVLTFSFAKSIDFIDKFKWLAIFLWWLPCCFVYRKQIHDYFESLKYKKVTVIDRNNIEHQLSKYYTDSAKEKYILRLIEDKVKLKGTWTNNKEPKLDTAEGRRLLTQLDSQDLDLAKRHFM